MKKYPTYKKTNIEWIDEIPDGWDVVNVRWLFDIGRGRVIPITEMKKKEGYPVYSSQTENNGIMGYLESFDFEGKYLTWTTDGANAGTVFFREGKFNCTNVCGTLRLIDEHNDIRYFQFLLNLGTKSYVRQDINPKLMNNMMASIPTCLPSRKEQTTIATYLDHKTALIDKLIEKNEKMIELLEEKRQAVINQAVTKGVPSRDSIPLRDGISKTKPSGIEWIGEIPEGWEVVKLKYLTSKIGSGVTPKGGSTIYEKEGIPLIRSQNVYNDGLRLEDVVYITQEIHNSMINSKLKDGDVLLNITGASIGRSYFLDNDFEEANVNQHVCIIRSNNRILTKFLHKYLISDFGQRQIKQSFTGSNREGLNFETIANFILLVPERNEQKKIINYIDEETSKIQNLKSNIQKKITLLQEYRKTLISDVVTGKVDVREEVF